MSSKSYSLSVVLTAAMLIGGITVSTAQVVVVDVDPDTPGIQTSYATEVGAGAFDVDVYLATWDTTGATDPPFFWNSFAIAVEFNDSGSCPPASPVLTYSGPNVFDPSGVLSAGTTPGDVPGSAIPIGPGTPLASMGYSPLASGFAGPFCGSDGGVNVLEVGVGTFLPPLGTVLGGTAVILETVSFIPSAAGTSDVAPIGLWDADGVGGDPGNEAGDNLRKVMGPPATVPLADPPDTWPSVAEIGFFPTSGGLALALFPAGTLPVPPGLFPGSCAPVCPGTVTVTERLPVELTRFEATSDRGSVELYWETASELNNAGFEVQQLQRVHGADVPVEDWVEVGFVTGVGTTDEPQSYRFTVSDAGIGRNVFRLKQIDFDGAFDYSHNVEVVNEVPGSFVLEPAYPNPFNPATTVRFAVATDQHVEATLVDALGKPVRSLYSGTTVANEMTSIRVDGSGLSSGVYFLQLRGNDFVGLQKLLLLK